MSSEPGTGQYVRLTDLKVRRRKAGVTQKALAAKAGVDIATVWRAEDGRQLRRSTAAAIETGLEALSCYSRTLVPVSP